MNNNAVGEEWEDVRKRLFTPEEIVKSDQWVASIGKLLKKKEKNEEKRGKRDMD